MSVREANRRYLGELAMAGVFMLIGLVVFWQTRTVFAKAGAASGGAGENSALYPEYLAGALILFGLAQLAMATREWARARASRAPDIAPWLERANLWRAFACLAALVVYLLSLHTVGYGLATPVFLLAMFLVLKVRNFWMGLACAVLTSLVLSLFFETGLSVVLPVGTLKLWP